MAEVRSKEGGEIRFGETPALKTKQGSRREGAGVSMRSSARLRLFLTAGVAAARPLDPLGVEISISSTCRLISWYF